jgi:glycosyltransferase involved in cell wall biosynthesis
VDRTVLLLHASGQLSGGATHVLLLARGLARRGWQPTLVADPDGPLLESARALGIQTVPVPFMRGRIHPGTLLALRRALAARAPDVVHAHGSRAGLAAAMLARLGGCGAPLIYTEHGLAGDVRRSWIATRLASAVERTTLRAARRVIALSEYAARRIASIAPGAAARLRVIPNAVEPAGEPRSRDELRAELGLTADARIVGTIARFVPQKAPLDLVAMASELARMDPKARVLAIGDGPLRVQAEREAARTGAPLVFAGARADAAALLPALDVFVLVSHWEGVPIAVLEAMAAGVPVVATDVGGTSSIVRHGETGILVPPAEPARFAQAVRELLEDRPFALALAERALAYVRQHHDEESLLGLTEAVYLEVLGSGR